MSNQEENKTTKKENVSEGKKIIKYLIGLAGIFLIGFIGGFAAFEARNILTNEAMLQGILGFVSKVIPAIYVIVNVVVFIVAMTIYSSAKKMADSWNGEEEDTLDMVEKKLNVVTVSCNIVTVINCFFYGAMIEICEMPQVSTMNISLSVFTNISFLGFFAMNLIVAKLVVDLIKRINPEKSAVSLFDKNFEKQWENSSDEAQKMILYKAGYAAYRAANMVCAGMWVITLMAQLIYKIGVFPMFCVCVIWVTLISVNSITQAKLESGVVGKF